jgi:glycosyltransferase involved in cell wall biosynthesis
MMEIKGGKKRAVVVKANLIDRDPWLAKVLDTLRRGGYEVVLVGWDREGKLPRTHRADGYGETILRFRAPWGPWIILFYPVWWGFVFYQLLKTKWDIAQAINLECIIPAIIAARLRRRPIVYQVYDFYADVFTLPSWLRRAIIGFDKIFMRLADAVIIANEFQEREINGIPNRNVVPIYNPPPDVLRTAKQRGNEVFTLFYAGVLYRFRLLNLDKVFQAINDIDGVKLVVAGYGDMDGDIAEWVRQADGKAEFLGRITYQEVLERTLAADLLFALYSANIPTQKYAASANKLSEAMMAQKPVIVTRDTAMAELVTREDCGLTVDPENVGEIRQAIMMLKNDPDLCRRLGANGRRAYEQKYSREIMEKRQLDLYEKIFRERKTRP